MSVIETPPKDRLAIQTIVAKFDEKLVRTAIELELERGGQVYFVHNRVETIYEMAAQDPANWCRRRASPWATGRCARPSWSGSCWPSCTTSTTCWSRTTIIENGLDIPLANTIIINRADRYGLASCISCAAAWAGPTAAPTPIC